MNKSLKGFISGLLAGSIYSAGSAITLLQEFPVEQITAGQWWTMGLGGFLAAAVGWRTLLANP